MNIFTSNRTWLSSPTRFIFFTGKGGVGKTSLSTATAIYLADSGKQVLLVSTDAASNLDVMLNITLSNHHCPVPGVPGLEVLNIDPDHAAEAYRQRVISQMSVHTSDQERTTVLEQLSGSCTTEIASFDEFSSLLAGDSLQFDHVIFDTAPSGHTLRLLSLPQAWSGFLANNDQGASCLGPHSGLKMQETRFNQALAVLTNPALTSVELITRPEVSALNEAARTSEELKSLGLSNQRLIINGVFRASTQTDAVASAIERQGRNAVAQMPMVLRGLPCDEVPLRSIDNVGLPALRALLEAVPFPPPPYSVPPNQITALGMKDLVAELAENDHGLIMVMGKGGVGKTTLAAALALGLLARGKTVHLSTTDPAAHLTQTLGEEVPNMQVSRIDPKVETQKYIDKIMASKGPSLDENEKELLLEDLQSPCTEEVAVFHAFSHLVAQARSGFVVLDTAPTGHSLLLMDAAGAYHRQMMHSYEQHTGTSARITTPLMRLQDASYTRVILVTLPESTPVLQAAALQNDLRRAKIEPYAWIINQSVLAAGTQDPLLVARLEGEIQQVNKVQQGLSGKFYIVPFLTSPPIGVRALRQLSTPLL
ncbi:MAG: arsenite-transporting ATPase [Verrucomicrobia bacterium]|nr:MAG: arsenite-transporting ATPase [Verrucomicrobiota bacterium]